MQLLKVGLLFSNTKLFNDINSEIENCGHFVSNSEAKICYVCKNDWLQANRGNGGLSYGKGCGRIKDFF